VLIIIRLTNQTRHVTGQFGYGGVPGCCTDPVSGYQMLSSYFYVSQVSRQTYRCLCTPHKRTLFGEGKRGVRPRLNCIHCQGVWGMWRVAQSLANTEARPSGTCRTGSFIAKLDMAMKCNGVGGEEVGVKCGCMQGCCEGARPGVRSWQAMVR